MGKMFKSTLLSSFKNKMAALILRKDLNGLMTKWIMQNMVVQYC